MEERTSPNYRQPPVVETVLGVQFEPLSGFKNGHLGAFWGMLGTELWPNVSDAPPLEPQVELFEDSAQWVRAGLQLKLSQNFPSRLQIKSKSGDRMIQIQNGRLCANWLGDAGGPYPRYKQNRLEFAELQNQFLAFVAEEKLGVFRPNQWEVTYLNHIPKGPVWKTPSDWSFFRPLGEIPSMGELVNIESFGGEWHFVIPPQRGRLHVRWEHGAKAGTEKQELIVLTLTARGPIPVNEDDAENECILAGLDLGHDTIVHSFERLSSDSANKEWGLEHGLSHH